MAWDGLISMPHCEQCEHCGDEEPCVIDNDDFEVSQVDTGIWTIESGDWRGNENGRLAINGSGRLTMNAEPDGGEGTSTKILTHVRCTEDGTAYVTIAEDADGNRLAVEMTQDGVCLTFRLCTLDDAGVPDYHTPDVAQFVTTDAEQVHLELCWVQGEPIQQVTDTVESYAATGLGSPGGAWTSFSNALGETDTVFNSGDFSVSNPLTCSFGGFNGVPDGSIITGIEVGIVCTAGESDPGNEVQLTSLRITDGAGTPVGDDKGDNQVVSTAGTSTVGGGGAADDWNAFITWEDLNSGNFAVKCEWTCTDGTPTALDVIQIDSCLVTIYYTGPDRLPGKLTVVFEPVAGMPTGYSGKAMAAASVFHGGTKAGITVTSGSWDFSEFVYYYEFTSSPSGEICPTCPTQCFIFGDTFDRTSLGCHYEVLSGSWSVDDTDKELTCDTSGQVIIRHITISDDNAQVVSGTATFPSQTNECSILLGYDPETGNVVRVRFDFDHVAGEWVIEIYENGDLLDSATFADASSFPNTRVLTACLLGNTVFASMPNLDLETNLTDTPIGLQPGLEGDSGMVFEQVSFYGTPFNQTDCPPCGLGVDNCTICEDGQGPENLLVQISGVSQRSICGHCFRLNGTFLLPGISESLPALWSVECDPDNEIDLAIVCAWGGGLSVTSDGCFEPGGSVFEIFVYLVKNTETNQYWLYVRIGGPNVTDPSYTGDFAYIWLREPLGSFTDAPDCYQLLTDVRARFLCTDDEDDNFDCDGRSAVAVINAA